MFVALNKSEAVTQIEASASDGRDLQLTSQV